MSILADRSVLQQNGPQADIFAPFRAIESLQRAIVNEKRLSAIRACQRLGRRRFQKGDRNSLEGPVPNAEFTPRTPTRIKSIGRAHQFVARHPIRPGNGTDFVQALSENETTRHHRMPPIRVENEMPFHRRLSGNASADQRGGLRLAASRLQRGHYADSRPEGKRNLPRCCALAPLPVESAAFHPATNAPAADGAKEPAP